VRGGTLNSMNLLVGYNHGLALMLEPLELTKNTCLSFCSGESVLLYKTWIIFHGTLWYFGGNWISITTKQILDFVLHLNCYPCI